MTTLGQRHQSGSQMCMLRPWHSLVFFAYTCVHTIMVLSLLHAAVLDMSGVRAAKTGDETGATVDTDSLSAHKVLQIWNGGDVDNGDLGSGFTEVVMKEYAKRLRLFVNVGMLHPHLFVFLFA